MSRQCAVCADALALTKRVQHSNKPGAVQVLAAALHHNDAAPAPVIDAAGLATTAHHTHLHTCSGPRSLHLVEGRLLEECFKNVRTTALNLVRVAGVVLWVLVLWPCVGLTW